MGSWVGSFELRVIVSNTSEHDVVIPAGFKFADISTYKSILSKQHSVNTPAEVKFAFQFWGFSNPT